MTDEPKRLTEEDLVGIQGAFGGTPSPSCAATDVEARARVG
jgi:hypothetical protein